jgi:hypothetical protein
MFQTRNDRPAPPMFQGFKIPRRLVQQFRLKDLSPAGLLLYIHVAHQMYTHFCVQRSLTHRSIETATGLWASQILNATAELVECALLHAEIENKARSTYTLIT